MTLISSNENEPSIMGQTSMHLKYGLAKGHLIPKGHSNPVMFNLFAQWAGCVVPNLAIGWILLMVLIQCPGQGHWAPSDRMEVC